MAGIQEIMALADERHKAGDQDSAESLAIEATRLSLRLIRVQRQIEEQDLD